MQDRSTSPIKPFSFFRSCFGKLTLDLPEFTDSEVEISYTVQKAHDEPCDALGWLIGFFDQLDSIDDEDMQERPDRCHFEVREPVE